MQNYKISTNNREESQRVQLKAFKLGYNWQHLDKNNISTALCLYLYNNGQMFTGIRRNEYFNRHENEEISAEYFLELREPEEQQINNNMEIKLKCTTAPSKAKNITVGEEYEGIFVDANDDQVDTYKEATYFLCNNNAGTEARYRIELFGKPVAHRAPRAAKATFLPPPALPDLQQFKAGLLVERDSVSFRNNGNIRNIMNFGSRLLEGTGANCSCGVKTVSGLTDLGDHVDSICIATKELLSEEVTLEQVCFAVFEAVLRAFGRHVRRDTAFIVLSNTQGNSERYGAFLDEIATASPWRENPNTNNQIKVWIMEV